MAKRNTKRTSRRGNNQTDDFMPDFLNNGRNNRNNVIDVAHKFNGQASGRNTANLKQRPVELEAKTENQQKYLDALNDSKNSVVICIAPAGTGKTHLALNWAVNEFRQGNYESIKILRPIIDEGNGQGLGFLPGSYDDKVSPHASACIALLEKLYHPTAITKMKDNKQIELLNVSFLRGQNWENSVIVVDEFQCFSPENALLILTRVNLGSKLILVGDPKQTAKQFKKINAITDLIRRVELNKSDAIKICSMDESDIQRNPLIADFLKLYEDLQ